MGTSVVTVYIKTVCLLIVLHKLAHAQEVKNDKYDLYEEVDVGTFIGNLSSQLSQSLNLNFNPFETGNQYVKLFNIDKNTGVITTSQRIDREGLCQKKIDCLISFKVAVYTLSKQLLYIFSEEINVLDINDNNPTFPSRTVTLPIPENNIENFSLLTSVATDDDSEGPNSKISYRLDPPVSSLFELSTSKTRDGLEDLVITVKKSLDREVTSSYTLKVVATDNGSPQLNGTVLITIQVTDLNDNAPVFGQTQYEANVLENSDITNPVIIVSASDKDEGINAKLTYGLSAEASPEVANMFMVDPDTGKIFTRLNLDYEMKSVYRFPVRVNDNGSPQRSSFAYVTINVLDVNDNDPVITINSPGSLAIVEDRSVNVFIGMVRVSDRDSGNFGKVSCAVNDPNFSLDTVSTDVYQLKLINVLDREEQAVRNVVITCQDGDVRPRTTSTTLVLPVQDINDNAPKFIGSSLLGSVMENKNPGTSVVQVMATDLDEAENARVTYALTGGEDDLNLFTINEVTGVITTTESLDRELKAEYRIEVTASDHGQPIQKTSATVTIKVLDANDNPPKFRRPAFFNTIVENLPVGSPAGDVPAFDDDSKDNGRFAFSILNPTEGDGKFFTIDPDTGLLKSAATFDRETKSQYSFRVRVSDPELTNYFDIANVTVTIEDDNDHAPMVIQPPATNRTFHCQFNTTIGTVITTFISIDEDDPRMVDISYELNEILPPKQKSPLFAIDTYTGNLRVARQIRPEDVDTHKMDIVVRDGPTPTSQSSLVTISIVVEPGSEEAMRAFNSDTSKTNTIIVIIIVAATIILAIVIIAVICLLRRGDKKRNPQPPSPHVINNDSKLYNAAKWVSQVSIGPHDLEPEEVRATLEVPGEKKKKKEVSFSLEDDVVGSADTTGSHASVFTPSPKTIQRGDGIPFRVSPKPAEFIVMNGMTQPDYSQHLYDSTTASVGGGPDDRQYMEVNRQHAEDRYSDASSSGDTGTSDSGRGGSEDESHGHNSSSGDGDLKKTKIPTSVSSGIASIHNGSKKDVNKHACYQLGSDTEEIPGSPTPMLSEPQPSPHCYIRRSFDKLPAQGLGYPAGASTRASPSPSLTNVNYNSQPRHANARLALSQADTDGPYRVKKNEQQPQVLQTFSSPFASGVPPTNTHPAWRRAKGLDTSWRSASSYREDDDNTTTSGSYIINADENPDEAYDPDIMV